MVVEAFSLQLAERACHDAFMMQRRFLEYLVMGDCAKFAAAEVRFNLHE